MPLAAVAVVSGIMTMVYPLTDLPTEPRPVWPMFPSVQIPSTTGSRTIIDMDRS